MILNHLQSFLFDLDGTVYLGGRPLPGAQALIAYLRAKGLQYLFLSNNSAKSAGEYREKLNAMGIACDCDQVITSGEATVNYLKTIGVSRVYLMGTPFLERSFEQAGIRVKPIGDRDVGAVVLGFDKTITYAKLAWATSLIRVGVPFVATHPDKVCPTEDGYIPDCGAMIALMEAATDKAPTIIGKPFQPMVDMALERLNTRAGVTAMVGDRLYTDIKMGKEAALTSILVLSGETDDALLKASVLQPDWVVRDLADLLERLRDVSGNGV